MKIRKSIVVFDTADLSAESTFWARLLGGTVDAEDDWHTVRVDGEPRLGFQLAPNHLRPDWPDGEPQQMHLDLYIDRDEVGSAHDEVIELGATLLQSAEDPDAAEGFTVYADPAGHPFCLCWG
ncbi:VOC family protein [Planctomonas psychrotolerans]|uniref:VOC family protein n=1 Tax=Planctomonas psychrotolerans TaxID=2528712 RepID=UPI0012387812|nr:VOC family protein [Planctomonas psychrotolerans]